MDDHNKLQKPVGYYDTVTGTVFYLWWPTHTIRIGKMEPGDPNIPLAKTIIDRIAHDLATIEEERLVSLAMQVVGDLKV